MQHPVLITGLSGLLGSNLARICAASGLAVSGVVHRHSATIPGVTEITADLTADYRLKLNGPSGWLIHCAAAADPDWCEQNEAGAIAINVEASRRLARDATRSGWRFIYISSDSVFDGARGEYSEDDATSPVNVYARTKLAGEQASLAEAPGALIIRTNFFGRGNGGKLNLADWLLSRLSAGERVNGFEDVIFSPLFVGDLAALILELAASGQAGVFHLGACDHSSKYEFAVRIARAFELDASLVVRSSLRSSTLAARRPLNTSLDIRKVARVLGCNPPTVDAGIQRFRSATALNQHA